MNLNSIPAFQDNYIWVLNDETGRCLIVDPGEAAPVLKAIADNRWQPEAILLTHHHNDHVGGVADLCKQFPNLVVYGPQETINKGATKIVADGDKIALLGQQFQVFATPGHTLGHICFYSAPYLFCGDTLFSGGCGRLFEGTAAQMYQSLQRINTLPEETLICCAHEYTLSNLRFAHAVEPDNLAIQRRIGVISKLRQQGLPSLPSRLGDERHFNVFLRCNEDSVKFSAEKYALKCLENPEDTFTVLRGWKDVF